MVTLLLYMHCPVMTGVWKGCTSLNRIRKLFDLLSRFLWHVNITWSHHCVLCYNNVVSYNNALLINKRASQHLFELLYKNLKSGPMETLWLLCAYIRRCRDIFPTVRCVFTHDQRSWVMQFYIINFILRIKLGCVYTG